MRNYEKMILGTSDLWSTIHLSQQTSALYCKLSDFNIQSYVLLDKQIRTIKKFDNNDFSQKKF